MNDKVPETFKDFETMYQFYKLDLERSADNVIQNKLSSSAVLSDEEIENLLRNTFDVANAANSEIEKSIDNLVSSWLKQLNDQYYKAHTPRADSQPELTARLAQGQDENQYKKPSWLELTDAAQDPNIIRLANEYDDPNNANDPNKKAEITNQYKLKMKMGMANKMKERFVAEYKPQIKLKMT